MKFIQSLALAFGFAGLAQAHMEMIYPPPFKSKANPFAGSDVDYSMTAPLSGDGSNFPCKGYQSLFGTDAGQATASFAAGGTYNMTITGGANHGGGSCQASLSFDSGSTWKVIHSYIGNCPAAGTSSFDFTIPSDTPSGEAIFAWSWFNQIGNREMYMNCAAVDITGSSAKRASALSSKPDMFVANVGNSCTTLEGFDLSFPSPGDEVSNDSSNTHAAEGSGCATGSGSGGDSGSGSGDSSSAAPVVTTTAAATYSQPAVTSAPANDATSIPGGVFITVSSAPVDSAPTTVVNTIVVSSAAPVSSAPVSSAPADSAPTTAPNTLVTVTKSTAVTEPSATAPAATPSSGTGDGSSGDAYTAGTACSTEGEWNCVGGKQFQRCASGTWSVLMAVADGTKCSGSTVSSFAISSARRRRSFRSYRPRV
ncbi:hypothetical protein B0J13DRAFT_223385 [Dactylonectria estremocensis]|uniref:Spore coat protein SP96 n=1 Tax=Dactylonectria estremocensis TaxID=1079267 RepID=A0A9P9F6V5_9HYPO|nr:hypothetical protein B0J13DRAFT_223385 [Dactylonectria estremocensis]